MDDDSGAEMFDKRSGNEIEDEMRITKRIAIYVSLIVVGFLLWGFLGPFFTQHGHHIKKGKGNLIDIIITMFVLIIIFFLTLLDLRQILIARRSRGRMIFRIYNPMHKSHVALAIFFPILLGINIYALNYQKGMFQSGCQNLFFLLYMTFIGAHAFLEHGIYENGIVFRGYYMHWDRTASFKWIDHKTLTVTLKQRSMWHRHMRPVKFNIAENQRNNINDFLLKHIGADN